MNSASFGVQCLINNFLSFFVDSSACDAGLFFLRFFISLIKFRVPYKPNFGNPSITHTFVVAYIAKDVIIFRCIMSSQGVALVASHPIKNP